MKNNNLENIDVVILSGGLGTRLRELVCDRPKTMAEINQQPFLDILINYVSRHGFRRFILATGYLSEFIERYYQNKYSKQEIIVSREDRPLGTGGAIKNSEQFIKSDNFLVMNGDSFCDIDLQSFVNFHFLPKSNLVSIALSMPDKREDIGSVVICEKTCAVHAFREKQAINKSKSYTNAGIYLFNKKALSLMPEKQEFSLEHSFFPKLVGKDFYGFKTKNKVLDIGTPERYLKAQKFFLEKIDE